jgi:transposase
VWVPDAAHEALRDVVRAREAAKKDQLRAKHRLSKFLLRHGRRPPEKTNAWTAKYWTWLSTVRFEHVAQEATLLDYRTEVERAADRIERLDKAIDKAVQDAPAQMKAVIDALQALRGVAKVTATTLVTEVGNFSRFDRATELMGYGGLVPSERSSGKSRRQGAITKTGNAHLRRVLVEAAWQYRNRPKLCGAHKQRQQGVSEEIKGISWKAQHRLHDRYWRLTARGKIPGKAITAVARELLGFVWAVGVQAE